MPVAVVLVIVGLVACFAGYRLFRIVLGINGFILGAAISTSMLGASSSWALIAAALVGGLLGALLMIAAYFMGVGLVGAGLAAFALHLAWRAIGGEPPTLVLVIGCVLGALGALSISRLVVIFGTALGGAWTAIVGALVLAGDGAALRSASAGDVWVLYTQPAEGHWGHTAVWLGLSLAGVAVQMTTSSRKGPKRRLKKAA
jgi:hypothetical protein